MKQKSVGVVVARFQVAELHTGHHKLLELVKQRHEKLVVVLGVVSHEESWPTARNPLSFKLRSEMVKESYPDAIVLSLLDQPSDDRWSKELDRLLLNAFPGEEITLYGSRNSFLNTYSGALTTKRISEFGQFRGEDERRHVEESVQSCADLRRGIIYSQQNRAPIIHPTVDIAIVWPVKSLVLLGKKEIDCGKLRFVGGFVDPSKDSSFEDAAIRELHEEVTGAQFECFYESGSTRIDDWRYRGSGDHVYTTLYRTHYVSGQPTAADDLQELVWVPIHELEEHLAPAHQVLGTMLKADMATSVWRNEKR